MTVTVNGQEHRLAPGTRLSALVTAASPSSRGVAVAVNGDVVPRAEWEQRVLADGDRVEMLTAVQGG